MTTMTKRENSGGKAGRRIAAAALFGFSLCLATAQAQELPPVDGFRCETCSYPEFRSGDFSRLERPILDPASGFAFIWNRIPLSRLLAHGAWPEDIYQRNRGVFGGTAGRVARFVAEGWTPLHEAIQNGSNAHPLNRLNPAHLDHVLDNWPDALNSGLRNNPSLSGVTPLHLAAWRARGRPGVVERLLERGASVDPRASGRGFGGGATPLHYATSLDAFEALRAAGADINAQNDDGYTVLHRAALIGDAAAVRSLVAAGLDPNAATDRGHTPLLSANSLEAFEALRAAGANIRAKRVDGYTVLHQAARIEDAVMIVREWIAAGLDPNAATDDGRTPLHFAGSLDMFEALQAAGADLSVIEAPFAPDAYAAIRERRDGAISRNQLRYSVQQVGRFGDSAWFERLRAINPAFYEVTLNHRPTDRTLLHYAAERNEDREAVEALLAEEAKMDLDEGTKSYRLRQALCLAVASNGNPAVVEALLEAGADLNSAQCRALYVVARNQTPRAAEIVQTLLEAGASIDGVEPSDGGRALRPVYAAAMVQNMAMLDALIAEGANVNVDGSTMYYSLLADVLSRGRFDCGYGPVAERLRSAGARAVRFADAGEVPFVPGPQVAECEVASDEIRELIESGADLAAQDEQGFTALQRAASEGNSADIRALVEAGANVDAPSRGGQLTALHFAVWRRAGLETVNALIAAGADVNARDARGWTALHWAARDRRGDPAEVEALIAAGADVNVRDNALKQTALGYALRADIRNEAVAALLRAAGGF